MPQPQINRQENTAILSNDKDGGIAIICARTGKKLQRSNKRSSWKRGRSEKAKSSPACCRQNHEYPPGYTVFECRLDGNQPIAQVVQVPSDTTDTIIQNKTCMLLETKQSESGPSSRVVAYPAVGTSHRRRPTTEPLSFALETRDCPGGAVARAEKVAEHVDKRSEMCCSQPVTILETTKGATCPSGPSSRIVYGPVTQETAKSSETHETPGFYIQCTTTSEGPIARVTQVPRRFSSTSGDPGTSYEAFVKHDGTHPTAVVTQCNKKEESVQRACEFLETRVDDSGPRARAFTLPEGSSSFRHFTHLDVCPQENGPSARINQYLGQPQEVISGLRTKKLNPPNCSITCNYQTQPRAHASNTLKSVGTCGINQSDTKQPMLTGGRRNGLGPCGPELRGHVGPLKNSSMKRGRPGDVSKFCLAQCCRPASSPCAPCSSKPSPKSARRKTTTFRKSGICLCPVQQQCKVTDLPFSEMRPLPGGTVVPQCPPPSLPEIAPVPLGSNNFRAYKPRPKSSRPRNANSASVSRPKQTPKVDIKSKKASTSVAKKKKTKNKKTGSSGKHRKPPKTADEYQGGVETPVSEETYVECPAFASKGVQSVRICEKPTYVECPAFASKGNQSVCVDEKLSHVDCPVFESKGIQSVRVCEEQSYVECPAFQSKRNQTDLVAEEPSCVKYLERKKSIPQYQEPECVKCPAFTSRKSSETSSVYVPREDLLTGKYSEYFRPETLETAVACCAKRNRLQNECRLHIPETVLRMSYERRRNRHARTLISSGLRRRGFDDEVYEVGKTYCVRA